VTGIPPRCVAIACPYAPRIPSLPGPVPDDARLSGMPGLRFRTIADMITLPWHSWKDTANAVGLYGPPGFKSPILRSSQALSRNLQGWGLPYEAAEGCNSGCSCAHPWPHSASLIRSLASLIWSVATWV
jgi:hypothetical protein